LEGQGKELMQTEQSNSKAVKAEPEESRKDFLLKKKAKNRDHLPPALQQELDEILAEEKAIHDRAALLHTLSQDADTWGRKEIGRIRKEVTNLVKKIKVEETIEVSGIMKEYKENRSKIEKTMRNAMRAVQEAHNTAMEELTREEDASLKEARSRFSGAYAEAEAEISDRVEQTLSLIDDFTSSLPALTLDQLTELSISGVAQVKKGDFLVIPGAEVQTAKVKEE
jgi:hypothetical protein